MNNVHILIQRWFSDGEGWAYDSELPPSLRMEVVSQISQTANHFSGDVIERLVKIGGNKYELFIRIEPDLNCLDEKAKSRHPHIDIGILSEKSISPAEREQCLNMGKRITQRGEFLLSDVGLINQKNDNESSAANNSILLPLLLILLLMAYPAYLFFSAMSDNNRVAINSADNPADNDSENDNQETKLLAVIDDGIKNNEEGQNTLQRELIISDKEDKEDKETLSESYNTGSNNVNNKENINNSPVLDLPTVELKTIDQWAENEISALENSGLRLFDNKLKSDILRTFIEALNNSRKLRINYNLSNKISPESMFLENRFPHNEISYPDEMISEEDYHNFISTICKELNVSSFEEIGQRLNFKEFFKDYIIDNEKRLSINRIDNEIQDFILQFCPTEMSESLKEIAREIKKFWKDRFNDYNLIEDDIDIRPWYVIWYFSCKHLDGIFTPKELVESSYTEVSFVKLLKEKLTEINLIYSKLQYSSDNLNIILKEYFDCKEVFDRKSNQTDKKSVSVLAKTNINYHD